MTPTETARKLCDTWNRDDREGWMALAAPTISLEQGAATGLDAWAQLWDLARSVDPDAREEIESLAATGDLCGCEVTYTANVKLPMNLPKSLDPLGALSGVAPMERHVTVKYSWFIRLQQDGKIVSVNSYGLVPGLLQALQLPAAPGTRTTAPA